MTNENLPTRLVRFFKKVKFGEDIDLDCWQWVGCVDAAGYGKFGNSIKYGEQRSHRFAYKVWVGPVPKGLVLDHLCRNRACCNPNHLEAVTQGENTKRALTVSTINSMKKYCHKGHKLEGGNMRIEVNKFAGSRRCITCKKEYDAAYRLRRMGRSVAA